MRAVARVKRVLAGDSPFALVHAVTDDGSELKMELPAAAVRDLERNDVLVVDVVTLRVPRELPDPATDTPPPRPPPPSLPPEGPDESTGDARVVQVERSDEPRPDPVRALIGGVDARTLRLRRERQRNATLGAAIGLDE